MLTDVCINHQSSLEDIPHALRGDRDLYWIIAKKHSTELWSGQLCTSLILSRWFRPVEIYPEGRHPWEPPHHTRISLFFNSQSEDSISFIQCCQSWAPLKFMNIGGYISSVWKGDKNGECKQVCVLVLFFQNLVVMILATLQCCAVKSSNREWCNTRHVQNLLEWHTKLLR